MYRYVLARLQRADLVEDVLGDIFLEMVEALPSLRAQQEPGFFAWLFQIAHSKVMAALRQQAHELARYVALPSMHAEDVLPAPEIADPQASYVWREVLSELSSALAELTADQQFVVVGRFLAGQSIEDLAQALQKQPGAIRALQFRALATLAARMGHQRRKGEGDARF